MEHYDESKCEKVGNFYVPTCPIAGPVTIIGATAVLSKQVVVLFSEVSQCDAGVTSPLVGVVTSVFCSSLTPSEVLVVSLLQRLVWCFFLHFLQQNLDGH